MKLMLWSTYVKHPVGGMERTSLELALQLHRRGHDVVLVGPFDNAPELRAKIPPDMPYYYFDMHRSRLKPHVKAARLASRLIRQHSIELVSAHGSIFALDEVCRHLNVPMVLTVHGAGNGDFAKANWVSTNAIGVTAYSIPDANPQDGFLNNTPIEIRVYP